MQCDCVRCRRGLRHIKKVTPKRIVMGEGHPYYFAKDAKADWGTAVCLTKERIPSELVRLKWGETGNWNRVRLVLEVIE